MDPEYWEEMQQRKQLTAQTTQTQANDSDSPKGKPLPDPKESLTGQMRDDLSSADGKNEQNCPNDPYPTVPAEMKAHPQWVLWREETRSAKPTKIPYQVNGRKAQSNQANTWTDYPTVCAHRDNFSGIGFVFSVDDPYCGIDLDDCLAGGKLKAWAEPIVSRLKPVAYGEVSPSGNGIKFWTKAKLPPLAKHKVYISEPTGEAIEAYDRGRYFTVTGKGKGIIDDGQPVIDWIVQEHLTPETQNTSPPRSVPTTSSWNRPAVSVPRGGDSFSSNLSSNEVIVKIRQSKQSAKFDTLMQGNTTGYGSQSEADLALCGVVAFWTPDHAVIDAIFRQSALMRAKWDVRHRGDKATYGQMTIEEALSGNRETYKPKSKPYSPTRRRLHRTQQLYGGRR